MIYLGFEFLSIVLLCRCAFFCVDGLAVRVYLVFVVCSIFRGLFYCRFFIIMVSGLFWIFVLFVFFFWGIFVTFF